MLAEPGPFPQQPQHDANVVSRDGGSDSEDDSTRLFAVIQDTIQLDKVSDLVSAIRHETYQGDLEAPEGNQLVTIESPLFGSYHILFPLQFGDGARWLLKIPAHGTRDHFDEAAARALSSEALTMQLLRRETTIPVPEVYAFDATLENELGCPYILMRFIPGRSLYDCWFDKTISNDAAQAHRTRALQDIAAAMVQLGKFSFDQGGSILFDEQGRPASIGPMRHVDNEAMLDRLKTDDPDENAIYVESGPFDSPRAFYTSILDRRQEPRTEFARGQLKLLRMFFDWVSEPQDGKKKFVLCHPDCDIQNVIVSDDGRLQGLIDWDGVSSVPRSLGNQRYPSWLTRDWDPAMYRYKKEMEEGIEPEGLWEDSPESLAFYRTTYACMVESCLCPETAQTSGAQDASETAHASLERPVSLTRSSLVSENLYIAAENPLCTEGILEKVFDAIAKIVGKGPFRSIPSGGDHQGSSEAEGFGARSHDDDEVDELDFSEPDDFHIYDVACALADGELDDRRLGYLKTGFATLLERV